MCVKNEFDLRIQQLPFPTLPHTILSQVFKIIAIADTGSAILLADNKVTIEAPKA